MNIVLFDSKQSNYKIPTYDVRVKHIRSILHKGIADTIDIGVINGPRGKGEILSIENRQMEIKAEWTQQVADKLHPIRILIGLPRPQTVRKILKELTTLGVSEIIFYQSDKSEPSYINSKLWSSGEWKNYIKEGAEQAFSTSTPKISHIKNLEEIESKSEKQIALDNYDHISKLGAVEIDKKDKILLAIGSERGWSNAEREKLKDLNYKLYSLGRRILRTETASLSACSVILQKLGIF